MLEFVTWGREIVLSVSKWNEKKRDWWNRVVLDRGGTNFDQKRVIWTLET